MEGFSLVSVFEGETETEREGESYEESIIISSFTPKVEKLSKRALLIVRCGLRVT